MTLYWNPLILTTAKVSASGAGTTTGKSGLWITNFSCCSAGGTWVRILIYKCSFDLSNSSLTFLLLLKWFLPGIHNLQVCFVVLESQILSFHLLEISVHEVDVHSIGSGHLSDGVC